MKRTITLMSVVLSMATVASLSAQKLQSRKANLNPRDAGVEIRVVKGPSVLREGSHPSESMGKLTLFHREDFSLMTAGTELNRTLSVPSVLPMGLISIAYGKT